MGKNNPLPESNTSRELSAETAGTKIYLCGASQALYETFAKTCAISATYAPTQTKKSA